MTGGTIKLVALFAAVLFASCVQFKSPPLPASHCHLAPLPAKPTVPNVTSAPCTNASKAELLKKIQQAWKRYNNDALDADQRGVAGARLATLLNQLDHWQDIGLSRCFTFNQWKLMQKRWSTLDGAYNQLRNFYAEQRNACK